MTVNFEDISDYPDMLSGMFVVFNRSQTIWLIHWIGQISYCYYFDGD